MPIKIDLLTSGIYTIEDANNDTFLTLADNKKLVNIGVDRQIYYCKDDKGNEYEYSPIGVTAMIINHESKRYSERITLSSLINNSGIIERFLSSVKNKEFTVDIADPFHILLSNQSEYVLVLPDFIMFDNKCRYYEDNISYLAAYINKNYIGRFIK